MNDSEFIIGRTTATQERFALCDIKAQDYTRGAKDRHANFKRLGQVLGVHPMTILTVYMHKHWDAVMYFCQMCGRDLLVPPEPSEPILGRIDDLQNYLDLLRAMILEYKLCLPLPLCSQKQSQKDTEPALSENLSAPASQKGTSKSSTTGNGLLKAALSSPWEIQREQDSLPD